MSKKLTYEYVKNQIEKEGETLISPDYKGDKVKLEIGCRAKVHTYCMSWSDHKQGKRCKYCANIRNANLKRHTYEYVKLDIESKGETLLSLEYKSAYVKLHVLCSINHDYWKTWHDHTQGYGCPECGGSLKLTYEYVKNQIEKEGETLISPDYKNARSKLIIMCSYEHVYNKTWANHKRGQGCPKCNKGCRQWENSVYQTLLLTFPNLEQNQIGLLKSNRSELDILDLVNLRAIELDGPTHYEIMWFDKGSPKRLEKQIQRDLCKTQECLDAGIKLLRVKYSEYMKDPEGSLAKIVEFLS